MLELLGHYRSSATHRVRLALLLKKIEFTEVSIHLLKDGGQHLLASYSRLNPQQLVPALKVGNIVIPQSMAILEYLEQAYPKPALLPKDAEDCAQIRAMTQYIISDIHPLLNLRVVNYLDKKFGATPEQGEAWRKHWLEVGFSALEAWLEKYPQRGVYCYHEQITFLDICLYAQLVSARRFNYDTSKFKIISTLEHSYAKLPEFIASLPGKDPS